MLAGIPNWPTLDGSWGPEFNVHHHKEYTLSDIVDLFERSGFAQVRASTFEQFSKKSLKKRGRLQTMGIETGEMSRFGKGFNPKHPYEYARLGCLAASKLVPSLRSSLIVSGRKPTP